MKLEPTLTCTRSDSESNDDWKLWKSIWHFEFASDENFHWHSLSATEEEHSMSAFFAISFANRNDNVHFHHFATPNYDHIRNALIAP